MAYRGQCLDRLANPAREMSSHTTPKHETRTAQHIKSPKYHGFVSYQVPGISIPVCLSPALRMSQINHILDTYVKHFFCQNDLPCPTPGDMPKRSRLLLRGVGTKFRSIEETDSTNIHEIRLATQPQGCMLILRTQIY